MITAKLDIPMYRASLSLEIGGTVKDAWDAYTHDLENGDVIIRIKEGPVSFDTVGHEIQHAVDALMRHIGHRPKGMDEPRAYLAGHLHGWVHSELKKAQVWVKC